MTNAAHLDRLDTTAITAWLGEPILEFHEYANIFPLIEGSDLESLVDSVKQRGLRNPIVLYEGKILDGRNRYLACLAAEVEPVFCEFEGDDPLSFVLDENKERRNMDATQKAFAALKLMPYYTELAKERMRVGGSSHTGNQYTKMEGSALMHYLDTDTGKAAEFAAVEMGVSARYVYHAQEIAEKAPELVEVAASGGLPMKEALHEIHDRERAQKRAEMMEAAEKQEAKAYGNFLVNDVYVADVRMLALPESSVDMIFTDPPYDEASVPLFNDLARFARRVLKPGGYLMTYTGHMFLPQVIAALGECLEYVWEYGVFQPDSNQKIQKHHIFQAWRPILVYKQPGKTAVRNWQPDSLKGTRDKSFHEWQQQIEPPLKWIEAYTHPGDLVVDPFVGGGTTLVACKLLKRHYLGFDIDPMAVKVTKMRLEK